MRGVIKKRAYSPGPWKWTARSGGDSFSLIAADGHEVIDDGTGYGEYIGCINPIGRNRDQANAALLAAAPELMNALRNLVECCADMSYVYGSEIETARAIINKLDEVIE